MWEVQASGVHFDFDAVQNRNVGQGHSGYGSQRPDGYGQDLSKGFLPGVQSYREIAPQGTGVTPVKRIKAKHVEFYTPGPG